MDYTVKYRIGVDTGQSAENLEKVSKAGEKADQKLKQITNTTAQGSGSATYALTNFNRVIQDVPYGFTGIANNIDPLVSSFQKLKQETGSGTAAMKALLGSLSGPTGLLFGINLLVLGIQVLPGLFEKLKGKANETKKALNDVQKAFTEVASKEESKMATMKLLSTVLMDNKKSIDQKKSALIEIQKIYPDYLKGVDLDKISQTELNAKIKEGNNLIARRAEMMAYEARLRKSWDKKLEIQENIYAQKPSDNDYGDAAKSMGYGRLGLDVVYIQKLKNDPNFKALVDSRARLLMIKRLEKELLAPIEEGITRDTATILALSQKTTTPATVPPQLPDDPKIKSKAEEVGLTLLEMILEGIMQNAKNMDETKAQKALALSTRTIDYRNLPSALDPTWRGRTLDNSLADYDPAKDLIDSSIQAEVRIVRMDSTLQKFLETLSKVVDLSGALKKGFEQAGDAVVNEMGDSIFVFRTANSLLEIFINTLVRVATQSAALSVIRSVFSFLGGLAPFLSFLIPGAGPAASGGGSRSLTGGIGVSPGDMNLLRNISRQTMNFGGEIVLRATGSELKKTLRAEELFRVNQR